MPTRVESGSSGAEELNPLIHERNRLRVLAYLAAAPGGRLAFTALRDELELTPGNLSAILRTLEEAGLIDVQKRFEGRRPLTEAQLTDTGRRELEQYVHRLEELLARIKNASG